MIPPPPSLFITDFLFFNGETNLFAILDGENDLGSFANFGDFVGLAGEERESGRGGPLILTENFAGAKRGGGDLALIRNLCCVCRSLEMTGDLVRKNLW